MSLRLVFLGSGRFAVPCLEALFASPHHVAAVITQPDREKGRGRRVSPPPVGALAHAAGARLLQPERIRDPAFLPVLAELKPELLVVVAYGQILPIGVLELPARGAVNVHASLLPRHRGAAPIQWALLAGDEETGVSTMQLDAGMDTGPVLAMRATRVAPGETAGELEARLAPMGAALLLETLAGLEAGTLVPRPQDDARATRAPLLRKDDGRLDWSRPAPELERRIRGVSPWPGAFTLHAGRRLKVLRAALGVGTAPLEPGTLVALEGDAILVACGGGSLLRLREVQPESRRPMAAQAFAAGARLAPGERLG